jgi:hypothetical protein
MRSKWPPWTRKWTTFAKYDSGAKARVYRMSIKLLAKDLYRLQQEVDRLEAALAEATFDERIALEEKLRIARAQKAQLRRVLDGKLER